jgi:drug/metabolite transporter (DMT)-like permease
MQTEAKERLALLGVWFIPALWAVNYIIARKAPGTIAPYALALGRWAVAGAIVGWVARKELWAQRHAIGAVWYQYVALGFFGMLVCGAWVYLGAQTTQTMNIALIYSASPVLIAIGAAWWLGEPFRASKMWGVAMAMAGVVHVVVKGQWLALTQVQWVVGDLWIVAAMVSWAAYALLQKVWPSSLSATARLAATCMGGVALLVPCAAWEAVQPGYPAGSWAAAGWVLLAALAPGVGAYWIYGWAQRLLGASRVAVSLYLGPLYAALAAYSVMGEPLGIHHVAGAALILPGVYWVSRK